MELNLDKFKEKQKLPYLHKKGSKFSIVKIMGQDRIIYSKLDEFSNIQHFIVLKQDIAKQYANNELLENYMTNITEEPVILNEIKDNKTFITTNDVSTFQTQLGNEFIFGGQILKCNECL